MDKRLVIVESPTKAKTIKKFLGKQFEVTASYGHVRDLPNNASEIPEKVKKEKWSRIGVNVDKDFEPLYIIPEDKKKRVNELKKLVKECAEILLATDEDREGESISWHLIEVLKPKIPVKRLVFHEITKQAIQTSLESARDIDDNLVKAQETRRIVDRLFGYSVSPLLWKKMAPRLSAGRVQSVALRLLVERERERIKFVKSDYWDLKALFSKGKDSFEAELTHLDEKRIAVGKDFDPYTGKLKSDADVVHLDNAKAAELAKKLESETPLVKSVEEKPFTQRPAPPFTTSTMQQEASRKLGFSARHTMRVAQSLYENGLITYMRTDSTTLSDEALNAARTLIEREYGPENLPDEVRIYKTKVRNAQEAHEAIRPAGETFASLTEVKEKLGSDAYKLYELIWKRTIACQMKDARGTRISVKVQLNGATFRAAGKTIEFPGFLRAYVEGSDDPDAELADREKILPKMSEGETLTLGPIEVLEHSTLPPARFTEGSLIKELEKLGIGRPSTWATIVDVVLSRTYAFKKSSALVPTFLAHAVIGLLERYFTNMLDYDFTARMEDDLDEISRGERDNLKYLNNFYSGNGHPGLKKLVEQGEENIDPRDVCGIPIGKAEDGRDIEVRIGRYGPFISDGETRSSLPDSIAPDELTLEKAVEILIEAAKGPTALGEHPEFKKPVYLKTGRFGPYVQLGDMEEGGDKPKMVSLLPGMTPEEITFEIALKILELPKNLGPHPEMKEDVIVANGRYGPYIKCGTETRSIPTDDISPIEMTMEQAIELFKQPKRRGRSQPKVLKELGNHPDSEKPITLRSGRYGPYVTDGTTNASVPKGVDPQELSFDEAVRLINERAAKGPSKRKTKKKAKAKTKAKSKSKTKAKTKSKTKAKTKSKTKAKTKAKAKSKTDES